jgi:hypothetical protein
MAGHLKSEDTPNKKKKMMYGGMTRKKKMYGGMTRKKKMGGGMMNKKRMGMAMGGAMEVQKPN